MSERKYTKPNQCQNSYRNVKERKFTKSKRNFQRKSHDRTCKAESEIVSYFAKERTTEGIKKTTEVTNPDGETDKLKVTKLDDNSTPQEIIDTLRECDVFCIENELLGEHNYNRHYVSENEVHEMERVLKKKAKVAFKHWKSLLAGTLRND